MGKKTILVSILGIANFSATKERDFSPPLVSFFLKESTTKHVNLRIKIILKGNISAGSLILAP